MSPMQENNNMDLISGRNGMDRLVEVVRILRSEQGCPWDREQTLDSLKKYFIEEVYELIDAIDSGEPDKHEEELGDVLMHLILQSQIRSESGEFTIEDVADKISEKLVRRHPHVFSDTSVESSAEVLDRWREIKAGEKKQGRDSVLDGVPKSLPAIRRAQKLQVEAARVGFDWEEVGQVLEKIEEELSEIREAIDRNNAEDMASESGDLLFAVVNLVRFLGLDAADAMDLAIAKFIRRFKVVEQKVAAEKKQFSDCNLDELEGYWQDAKRSEQ